MKIVIDDSHIEMEVYPYLWIKRPLQKDPDINYHVNIIRQLLTDEFGERLKIEDWERPE